MIKHSTYNNRYSFARVVKASWKGCFLLLLLFFTIEKNIAQDIHFSQYNFSPLNQNPANTNLFAGDYRLVANYKNQWQSVPAPFNTFSFSGDMNFVTLKDRHKIGGGLLFYFDRAGDSKFTSYNLAYAMSYIVNMGKKDQHNLSLGYQIGFVNRSFSYEKLFFDNQFNGDFFNPNTPPDETFSRTQFFFLDMSVGAAYQWYRNMRQNFTVGFSLAHPHQPSQTFFNDNAVRLNMRYNVQLKGQFRIARKCDIIGEMLFQRQDTKMEFVPGLHFKTYLSTKGNNRIGLNTGAYVRPIDAAWALIGVDYNDLQINLTYDINTSRLKQASRYNGGIEVSAIYIISKIKKIRDNSTICPIF